MGIEDAFKKRVNTEHPVEVPTELSDTGELSYVLAELNAQIVDRKLVAPPAPPPETVIRISPDGIQEALVQIDPPNAQGRDA